MKEAGDIHHKGLVKALLQGHLEHQRCINFPFTMLLITTKSQARKLQLVTV